MDENQNNVNVNLSNAEIEYQSQGMSNMDITQNILYEYRRSDIIKDMKEAEKYYKVENTAIDTKSRSYSAPESNNLVENETLSNVKSKTAQYRISVNQKYNYSLGKEFVISCEDDAYKEEWTKFLNKRRRAVIQRAGKLGAINKGIGWVYPWIDENGELQIKAVKSETIYPAWNDEAHTELDAVVRDYKVDSYGENFDKVTINKVEYWDSKIVEKYIDKSNGYEAPNLFPENDKGLIEYENELATIQSTHMSFDNGEGVSWDRVPFIPFKGSMDELPLLKECKSDIDAYDNLKSKAIDSLIDDIDPTIVVKGISAEMGELVNARKIIQNARIMSLDTDGDAHVLKVDTDISQVNTQLEVIKKDIQHNTSTVDLTTIELGSNPSGVSMKSYFENLDIWCNGFEAEFKFFMEGLKYFFDKWLSFTGFRSFEELQSIDIEFDLDRDMMVNEAEVIENIAKLHGLISDKTLFEMNPWVDNPEEEKERIEKEEEENRKKDELFNFENELTNFNNESQNNMLTGSKEPSNENFDENR